MNDVEVYDNESNSARNPEYYIQRDPDLRGLTSYEHRAVKSAIRSAQIDAVTGPSVVKPPSNIKKLLPDYHWVLPVVSVILLVSAFVVWGVASLTENSDLDMFGLVLFVPGGLCGIGRWMVWMTEGRRW